VGAVQTAWAAASGGGVGLEAGLTANDCLFESVSPSASRTVSLTYLVSATWNVLLSLQPVSFS
jgi:hypothetical protein